MTKSISIIWNPTPLQAWSLCLPRLVRYDEILFDNFVILAGVIRQQIVRGDIRRSDFVCAFIRGFTAVVFCAKADKWATIQAYYSMFHSARALLYVKSLREHSHYCLVVSIKTLYVEPKVIPGHIVEGFQEAKNLREDADYYHRWSQAGCEKLLKIAEEFLEIAKKTVSLK